ncbi:MurR/RpiR family transcriptional regulator [Prosthecomicrobium hirschii]|uniref:RpiR family transcriptional regulator n=1 Tax=Prosthecodimorpha hirschii TaxID=665126 RepID=A0A0P6VRZ4_9HYPH|nr:MurR/RpiR family transcriptional regulator [Prosthecomicrobium hirschii]KPL53394.1 RpiR family transcriptional regulator [Prosthecomicrobium hirschii]MCW1842454.1 MurR/RpiR family transcriptional regulator [Prosthecomicrobium hirschii]TPQ52771.1 MurR/RpiR family transcriptional regulator [Prosthecomicrobium hirschii]
MDGPMRQRLEACLVDGTKADRALAAYILARPETIPFETAATLAEKVEVSEATVGRFCRSIGYDNLKDLKQQLGQDFGDRPWLIADRLRDFQAQARQAENPLGRSLELEIAGLVAVYEIAQSADFRRVVERLTTARRVFVCGFQTERAMAQMFAHQLQYLRDGVQLLDLEGGHFAELFATDVENTALVLFEARRYSRLARVVAREAMAVGVPVTLVTDAFCDWGRGLVSELLVVPTEFNLFWDSTAQMASLVNLFMNAVSIEIGPAVEARMTKVSQLYARFTGHTGDPSGPES